MTEFSPAQTEPEEAPTDAEIASFSIFDFTPTDLKSNQQGFISERQRAHLQGMAAGIRRFSWSSIPIVLGFLLFGMCLILAMFMQNASSRAALFSSPLNLFLLAATAVVVLVLLALSIVLARRQAASLAAARLQSVQGEIRLEEYFSPNSAITSYRVYVGGHRFSFSEDMSQVFRDGGKYRVYYCKSGVYEPILSMEELSN